MTAQASNRAQFALLLEPMIAKKAKEQQAAGLKRGDQAPVCQNSDKRAAPIDTEMELAQIAGVSRDTIHRVKVIIVGRVSATDGAGPQLAATPDTLNAFSKRLCAVRDADGPNSVHRATRQPASGDGVLVDDCSGASRSASLCARSQGGLLDGRG